MEAVEKALRVGSFPATGGGAHKLDKQLLARSVSQARMLTPVVPEALGRRPGKGAPRGAAAPEFLTGTSLDAVAWLRAQHGVTNPAVLVFASDTNPGGSVKARNVGTQEEWLVRNTTLCAGQRALRYPIPALGVAYVPHVMALLPAEGPLVFGAVCAALRSCVSNEAACDAAATSTNPAAVLSTLPDKEVAFLLTKVCTVLAAAAAGGHKALVLGGWGCGAFGNPPHVVAAAFSVSLGREEFSGTFSHVLFAFPKAAAAEPFQRLLAP